MAFSVVYATMIYPTSSKIFVFEWSCCPKCIWEAHNCTVREFSISRRMQIAYENVVYGYQNLLFKKLQ